MKAAVLYEVGKPLSIEDVRVKRPGSREVLIRTKAAGLCHSDLHMMEGAFPWPLPTIPGHEASGVVEEVGAEVTYVKPGDHVITCLTAFCGCCAMCTTGRPVLCSSSDVRLPPGAADRFDWSHKEKLNQFINVSAFAEQMLVHENAVVKIRKDMPLALAALIGCAIVTGYGAVVNTANVRPGEVIAVIGCGGVGMAAINAAKIAGASRIIAIDTNPVKLRIAAKLGATDLINANEVDPVAQVKDLTDGAGVPHSFEMIGSRKTAEQSFAMLAPGGASTIVGIMPLGTTFELHGIDFIRERRIQGSYMGSSHIRVDMPRLVDFYLSGQLQLDEWVTSRIRLQDVNDGFASMKSGTVLRNLIEFN
ncbi:Zn-dependent alcohol dehydrogenase [Bradyrhizobium sp. HKCCYLS2038]|uniref:Zn-dependent alcohol dehydrogenase n=1 Tax=unclassified Bradyrhizobium TaxID=2631580 RepID=UPI003EBDCB84